MNPAGAGLPADTFRLDGDIAPSSSVHVMSSADAALPALFPTLLTTSLPPHAELKHTLASTSKHTPAALEVEILHNWVFTHVDK